MTPADIRRQVVVEELDRRRDGRLAVVVRRTILAIRYVTHLSRCRSTAAGPDARARLTSGVVRDTKPRIRPKGGPSRSCGPTRPTTTPRAAAADVGSTAAGCARIGAARPRRGRRDRLVAGRDAARVHRGGRSAAVPRRAGVRVGDRTSKDSPLAPPDHPHRLALGRGGPRRPLVALCVVDRDRGAEAAPGHGRRLGRRRHRLAPDGRTVAFAADRGPEPDLLPRTTIWAVDVDAPSGRDRRAARDPRPGRLGRPPGVCRRTAAGSPRSASGRPEPLDDISPTVLVGAGGRHPATRRGPRPGPRPADRQLGRHAT